MALNRERLIRQELELAESSRAWQVVKRPEVSELPVDVELSVIGLATYDGRAMMAEIDELRGQIEYLVEGIQRVVDPRNPNQDMRISELLVLLGSYDRRSAKS